jgi:signal transduction histidine kinase
LWFYLDGQNSALTRPIFFVAGVNESAVSDFIAEAPSKSRINNFFLNTTIIIFLGFLFAMLSFSFVYFFLTRQRVFAFYFLYILTTFFYFFHRLIDIQTTEIFWYHIAFLRDFTWQPLSYLMYYLFAIHFVNYKKLAPRLLIFMKAIIVAIVIYLLVDLFLHFSYQYYIRLKCYNYFRFIMGPIALFSIAWTYTLKDKLAIILATGTLFMVAGALTTLLIALNFSKTGNPWLDYHMFYMYIGTAIETMFFAMGLGYKTKLNEQAKARTELDLKLEKEKSKTIRLQTIIETQNKERERVALELHDDLGSGLASIKLLSEAAKTQASNHSLIERISEISTGIIENMRQIIWSMNPANYSLSELVRYIRNYSKDYLDLNNIPVDFKMQDEVPALKLNHEQIRNTILSVKELLHNIVKHAKASEVVITLQYLSGVLEVIIYDNGVGMIGTKELPSQNGLRSIKKRMEELHGEFILENKNGTCIKLKIPLSN